ncbi:MAG: GNAT family N-acetyltransferase [Fimbriimonadia bacterium]|nr:GNAT family N-acetyltransferase [Fimbriimonadia bacterium]
MPVLKPYQSELHDAAILALWNQRWVDRFPLDSRLWEQNTRQDPLHFRPDLCRVAMEGDQVVGYVGVKTPPAQPAWKGQNSALGWISTLLMAPGHEETLAPLLLNEATNALREAGLETVSYAADPAHFFPGIPIEDEPLQQVLQANGFQVHGESHDLFRHIADFELPDRAQHALRVSGYRIEPCSSALEPALYQFLERTFPGRWLYDTRRRLDREPDPSDVLILTDGSIVVGFVHVFHAGSHVLGPNVYWRGAMGENWGGLGPIGVAEEVRKLGLGFALLCYAVDHLRQRGVNPMGIDWTGLVEFYGKIGFQVWRTYRYASRALR